MAASRWSAGSRTPCRSRYQCTIHKQRRNKRSSRTGTKRHDTNENLGTTDRRDRSKRKIRAGRNRSQKIQRDRGTALLGARGDRSVHRLGDRQADRGRERVGSESH